MMENQETMYKHQYEFMNRTVQQETKQEGVADELLKLKHLLDTEAITQSEYESQKKRLLN